MKVPFCQFAGSVLPGSFAATGLIMAAKLALIAALSGGGVDVVQAHRATATISARKFADLRRCDEIELRVLQKLAIIWEKVVV